MRSNPDFDQWFTDDLLASWCRICRVAYDHCDTFMPKYYRELEQSLTGRKITDVVCVLYGGPTSEWVAAIRHDGEFVLRVDPVLIANSTSRITGMLYQKAIPREELAPTPGFGEFHDEG